MILTLYVNKGNQDKLVVGGLDGSPPVIVQLKEVRECGSRVVLHITAPRDVPLNRYDVYEEKAAALK